MARITITDNNGIVYGLLDSDEFGIQKKAGRLYLLSEIIDWIVIADANDDKFYPNPNHPSYCDCQACQRR